jgi:hypothetical protein
MQGHDEPGARTRGRWLAAAGFPSAVIGVLLATGTVLAQGLPIETSPGPTKQPSRVEPYRPPDVPARLPEAASYPRDVGVRLDPAFIEPLVAQYESKATGPVHLGLSGFTPPNVPVVGAQSGAGEVSGWLSFGFSLIWGNRR